MTDGKEGLRNVLRIATKAVAEQKNERIAELEAEVERLQARHISVTWGEINNAEPEILQELQPNQWDDMNSIEQQEFLLTWLRRTRTERDEAREDTRRLNLIEELQACLECHREGTEEEWTLWWNVVKQRKSISGHPQGSIRAAIDALDEGKDDESK